MFRSLLVLLALLLPTPAMADWREVSTKHFLVYGEGSESSLRDLATRLEKFDFLLRTFSGRKSFVEPMKIKIYVMPGMQGVQAMLPDATEGVAGYYTADVRGPIAVTTRADIGGNLGIKASEVLFHELSHHFMMQYYPGTYPAWYVEGFADYYGTIDIAPNDAITLGRPVLARYHTLRGVGWLPMEKLLTATNYDDVKDRLDMLYAEGWLLVHYLSNSKERAGQLERYLAGIAKGNGYEKSAREAFGDLGKLDNELRRYSRLNRLPTLTIQFKPIDVGPIASRRVSAAENALMHYDIQLGTGIYQSNIAAFAARLEQAASPFSNDPHALRLRTEAQRLAGNLDRAEQTAQLWLNAAPGDPLALTFKGLIQVDRLAAAKSNDSKAWEEARSWIRKGMAIAPRHPQILKAFYHSYSDSGALPPAPAQNAVVNALDIVPQDDELRYLVASDYEKRGLLEDAIAVIEPAAFSLADDADASPEQKAKRERERERQRVAGHPKRETAREMLARLIAKRGAGGAARSR
jgi:tetratricopeptide (TPR) repeat protein